MSEQPPKYDAGDLAQPVSSAAAGFSYQLLDGTDSLQVWREAVGEAVARLVAEGAFAPGDALRLESVIGASPRVRDWIDVVARVTVERADGAYDEAETIGVARAMLLTAVPDAMSEPKPQYDAVRPALVQPRLRRGSRFTVRRAVPHPAHATDLATALNWRSAPTLDPANWREERVRPLALAFIEALADELADQAETLLGGREEV